MKCVFKLLCPIVVLVSLQSCKKEAVDTEIITDPFTYSTKFNWREDSIKVGTAEWKKMANGNVFSWLVPNENLENTNFATYSDRSNIQADFPYIIEKDSVFAIQISSQYVYFLDKNNKQRTDIEGEVSLSPDSSLILINTSVSPNVSVKYRPEK